MITVYLCYGWHCENAWLCCIVVLHGGWMVRRWPLVLGWVVSSFLASHVLCVLSCFWVCSPMLPWIRNKISIVTNDVHRYSTIRIFNVNEPKEGNTFKFECLSCFLEMPKLLWWAIFTQLAADFSAANPNPMPLWSKTCKNWILAKISLHNLLFQRFGSD